MLQLGYQSQQLLPVQRGSVFGQRHGLKYRLPPLRPQASIAKQIRCVEYRTQPTEPGHH
jgi:hypothetical protein